jgi:hypothetical protein
VVLQPEKGLRNLTSALLDVLNGDGLYCERIGDTGSFPRVTLVILARLPALCPLSNKQAGDPWMSLEPIDPLNLR